jgi:hypothetical protein
MENPESNELKIVAERENLPPPNPPLFDKGLTFKILMLADGKSTLSNVFFVPFYFYRTAIFLKLRYFFKNQEEFVKNIELFY